VVHTHFSAEARISQCYLKLGEVSKALENYERMKTRYPGLVPHIQRLIDGVNREQEAEAGEGK